MNLGKEVRRSICTLATTLFLGVATLVPLKNRVFDEEKYVVNNVIHYSKKIDNNYILHFLHFSYQKGNFIIFNDLLYHENDFPNLNKLENGDTFMQRITIRATLLDMMVSYAYNRNISFLYRPKLEFEVLKAIKKYIDHPDWI